MADVWHKYVERCMTDGMDLSTPAIRVSVFISPQTPPILVLAATVCPTNLWNTTKNPPKEDFTSPKIPCSGVVSPKKQKLDLFAPTEVRVGDRRYRGLECTSTLVGTGRCGIFRVLFESVILRMTIIVSTERLRFTLYKCPILLTHQMTGVCVQCTAGEAK